MRILVTGGGSSGHISPALAVIAAANELVAQGETPPIEWLYLGGKRGLEQRLVEAAGIPFSGVETGKLRRYLSRENLTDLARIPVGVAQSLARVKKFRPDVVFATGGYVAVPPVLAARLLRVPILIHEQTVQIGLANRIAARCATRIGLAWESALSELSEEQRKRAFVVGNPVRAEVFDGDAARGKTLAGFSDDLPTLYVTGGSQGARIINRAVETALPRLLQLCNVIHQCGEQPHGEEQDFDRLTRIAAELPEELRRRYFLTCFVRREINDVFALADLLISRAGAGTIAEVCALGKAAIYIPLVPTGGDEQTRNAAMCVRAGAAEVIKQSELHGDVLVEKVQQLLSDPEQLGRMGAAARTLARPGAAQELARALVQLAGDKRA
ncbi:MAG TPA: undecaprenyldiphospho-muramoylpentapeptide beta-N-acetylglucosaminyltransferase [Abditibacteriaceae bacterium]|jgi:UDP-N-acetylglucosamine--N-acetylmuramyl-(pentapeptide) pyrophosphoryl-undecaprenol N-acetylglucosamine transferase